MWKMVLFFYSNTFCQIVVEVDSKLFLKLCDVSINTVLSNQYRSKWGFFMELIEYI